MIRLSIEYPSSGVVKIKIGRKTTILKTHGEADAFIAGFKAAHLELAAQIDPILKIKDDASGSIPKRP